MALLALAAVRPALALLVVAGLTPLAGLIGSLFGSPPGSSEALVLAFLGGWLAHEAAHPRRGNPAGTMTSRPALLFAGVVLASCAVPVAALQALNGDRWFLLRWIAASLAPASFPEPGALPSMAAAALLVEGSALYIATVTLSRRDPLLGLRVARIAVLCSAGVAALNVNRLVGVAARGGLPVMELAKSSPLVRISSAFPDVNAAGSYFAMMVLLSAGLMFDRFPRRAGWGFAALLSLGALWLTRSRAALGAAAVAAAIAYAAGVWARRRSLVRVILVGAAALGLSALAADYISRTGVRSMSWSANMRMELARTSLKMFAAHPLFGVGAGRYYGESSDYSSPDLPGNLRRENAHNNFLQILAELGIAGFAAFAWLLLAVGRHVWRAYRRGAWTSPALGAAGGLTAFLLTCLAGHPLLIPEVALAFWLVLGLAVGLAPEAPAGEVSPTPAGQWSRKDVIATAAVLILVVSVPVRALLVMSDESIGRPAEGLSAWQTDAEGTEFRWMGERAQFSIPAAARAVALPLRLDAPADAGPAAVEIHLDGQLLSRITLEAGIWQEFRFVMPPAEPGVHFRRLELGLTVNEGEGLAARSGRRVPPRIQVGRPTLTRPAS